MLPRTPNGGNEMHVWLTLAEDDAFIGIQGPDIGDEWREDVFSRDYWKWAYGEKPEESFVWMYFLSNEDLVVDSTRASLILKPSYSFSE